MNSNFLKIYYEQFFPADLLYEWLKIDEYREMSFCFIDGKYARNLIFPTLEEFIKKLISDAPAKIDVGGIYDVRPIKNIKKKILYKELVFDIDLTDYERTCCNEKIICEKCFPLIKVSVELLNYILKEELGFNNLAFVFSGRRGLHCWVNDSSSKKYNGIVRGNIVNYFEIVVEKKIYVDKYTEIMRKYESLFFDRKVNIDELYKLFFIKLDKNVTKDMNHLLKMPFSVHPSTFLISIPIDPDKIEKYCLQNIPSLNDILNNPIILDEHINVAKKWL